ncbi:ATP-binding protein [Arcobacter sp. YIC-80]|uniref:sensor histidine kinase n=1 Tax=unclassified Arcobacter TaxID=2593671 RepID=UPI00384CDF94
MLKIHQLFLRTFSLIFIAILISLSIVTYFWSKNIYLDQIEKNLIQNIDTLSIVLNDLDNVDNIIKDLHSQIDLRITIVDEKGNVIAESDKNKELLENHANRKEILEAKDFGIGKVIRYSTTMHKELLYIAKKVTINKKIYFIRMSDYTDNITDNFMKLSLQIFAFISFFIIIAFLASYFISLKIKDETENILDFLTQLASKKTTPELESNFTLEFHKITKILNKVAIKLKKKEKQKAKQNAKLKIANRQKDEIISALSHEFKNPIAIISGYSETILNDDAMPQSIKNKFLAKIHSNSLKMSNIIDKLRLTLKLEEGKQEIILLPTSMKVLIKEIISDLQDNYKNREIELIGEDIQLKVDSTLISMAISNLIENALKYSEDKVIVKINSDEIRIIDSGIGIEELDLENIKQKFYRVSKNGWNNSLGLGLFIVQAILNLHNFKLEIESIHNKGSEFSIKF